MLYYQMALLKLVTAMIKPLVHLRKFDGNQFRVWIDGFGFIHRCSLAADLFYPLIRIVVLAFDLHIPFNDHCMFRASFVSLFVCLKPFALFSLSLID